MRPSIWSCSKNHAHLFVRFKKEGCPQCKIIQLETINADLLEALKWAVRFVRIPMSNMTFSDEEEWGLEYDRALEEIRKAQEQSQ